MSKTTREAGEEVMAAMMNVLPQVAAMDDLNLAIYIRGTEKLLAAAKEEQGRRLGEIFLPPKP